MAKLGDESSLLMIVHVIWRKRLQTATVLTASRCEIVVLPWSSVDLAMLLRRMKTIKARDKYKCLSSRKGRYRKA